MRHKTKGHCIVIAQHTVDTAASLSRFCGKEVVFEVLLASLLLPALFENEDLLKGFRGCNSVVPLSSVQCQAEAARPESGGL